jgi:hypothetical protein
MKMLQSSEIYSTSDVYLAATLGALGHIAEAIDRNNPSRCLFLFANTPELQTDVEVFWRNQPISIVPQALFSSLRALKWQLHAQ